ncbi:MmgE/PrpD family protein [Monashia sp. NPDC004114]
MARATAATRLAELWGGIQFADLPGPAQQRVTEVFIDTVAVLVGGGREPRQRELAESGWFGHSPDGPCTVLATGGTAAAVGAAIANACCGNAQLLGEGLRMPGGHPAIHVVPAALAAAEQIGATTHELMSALFVGYETAARAGLAVGTMREELHPNGGWSVIGAAAGVAHLVSGGEPASIARAIEAAAGLAVSGPFALGRHGADVYHLVIGLGAGIAVSAGAMAGLGWTAVPGTLEDFFVPRTSSPRFTVDWAQITRTEPAHPAVLDGYIKLYPVCAHAASAIDAAAALADELASTRDIRAIEIRCASPAAARLTAVAPPNLFAGRYSIPFLCAVALSRGRTGVIRLEEGALYDEEVRRLSRATVVVHDPALQLDHPEGSPVTVKVTGEDGQSIEASVVTPLGEAANPLTREQLSEKALGLLARRFGGSAVSVLGELRAAVEGNQSVSEISRLLRDGARPHE